MKTPESLETLVDYGIIQEVIRPLMSGKEAQVYVVLAGGEECVAKVYKEAHQRTFKHRVEYTEGRRTRNTRDQRAINKRTRHGRKQDEAAWRTAEVDTIYRLRSGGVRVPEPINFVDGVLVMELVRDAEGRPAPRLGDLDFGASEAEEIYQQLIREVVRMLCAGVIHGDLSEFNVLMSAQGPVVIDFPQAVDPAKNPGARKLLLRDVENLHRFLGRTSPDRAIKPYGEEMWSLYETNRLAPDTELTGSYVGPIGATNTDEVLALIGDANQDEQMRRDARGDESPVVAAPLPRRRVVEIKPEPRPRRRADTARDRARPAGPARSPSRTPQGQRSTAAPSNPSGPRSDSRSDSRSGTRNGTRDATRSGSRQDSRDETRREHARPEKPRETDAGGSGGPDRPKRQRRGRRASSRPGTEGGHARAGSGSPQASTRRPASPSTGPHAGHESTSKEGESGPRPPRRRRRRTRAPGSDPV